jgi:hypothetical protein
MTMIFIDKLFDCDKKVTFEKMDDSYFLNHLSFNLSQIYVFELLKNSSKYPLFDFYDRQIPDEAILFKLDNHYYLTCVDAQTGYKSKRSIVYKLNINEKKLMKVLDKHYIKNQITLPVDVHFKPQTQPEHFGICLFANEFSQNEENCLMSFTTENYQDRYPSGHIGYYPYNYEKAFEIIEKQYLNAQISESNTKLNKIKI